MEREREIISLGSHILAPLINRDVLCEDNYSDYFTEDGDPNDSELWEFWNNFDYICDNVVDYDLANSYIYYEVIFQIKSDKKYFKGFSTSYLYDDEYPEELIEVFPKETKIIIYE